MPSGLHSGLPPCVHSFNRHAYAQVCAQASWSGGTQEAHLNAVPAPWGSLSSRGRHLGSGINKTVPGVLEAVGALEKDDGGKGDGAASRAATLDGRVRREPWGCG